MPHARIFKPKETPVTDTPPDEDTLDDGHGEPEPQPQPEPAPEPQPEPQPAQEPPAEG
jgi:colicin import membrane protein